MKEGGTWGDFKVKVYADGTFKKIPIGPLCGNCGGTYTDGNYQLLMTKEEFVEMMTKCWGL